MVNLLNLNSHFLCHQTQIYVLLKLEIHSTKQIHRVISERKRKWKYVKAGIQYGVPSRKSREMSPKFIFKGREACLLNIQVPKSTKKFVIHVNLLPQFTTLNRREIHRSTTATLRIRHYHPNKEPNDPKKNTNKSKNV